MAPTTAQIMTENTAARLTGQPIHPMIINCDFTHHYGSMKKRIP